MESLTDEVERLAWEYMDKIDAMGGAVKAIEEGYIQNEIANSAYLYQQAVESGDKIIVGVNKYQKEEEQSVEIFRVDDSIRQLQVEKLAQLKSQRNNAEVEQHLQAVEAAARGGQNLMPPIIAAVESYATLGEIADAMRRVFGEYKG